MTIGGCRGCIAADEVLQVEDSTVGVLNGELHPAPYRCSAMADTKVVTYGEFAKEKRYNFVMLASVAEMKMPRKSAPFTTCPINTGNALWHFR